MSYNYVTNSRNGGTNASTLQIILSIKVMIVINDTFLLFIRLYLF